MIAKVHTAALLGIEAALVVAEIDLRGSQDPKFFIVGLPDQAVKESAFRVKAAIKNSELDLPAMMAVVNLAPGDVRKEGTGLDLPIAVSLLAATEQVPKSELEDTLILGELGLAGEIRSIPGAVNCALMAAQAGFKRMILPADCAAEAAVAPGIDVYGVEKLTDVVALLNGSMAYKPTRFEMSDRDALPEYGVDYSDVKGQKHATRALEIAAAGGHNVLMCGPPGSGKTMLARRLPTILPPLTLEESIECTRVYSAGGAKGGKQGLLWERPFRSPHHSASYASIVGGGKFPKPGEVSLSHKGVLFLDEMPEFDRSVLEALREPLEDGMVTVSRVQASMTFPAECILIGAMNPCPCGYKGLPEQKCVGNPATCGRYAGRISGPLLDRIDLHIEVPRLKPDELVNMPSGEASTAIRERVVAARERQYARLGKPRLNSKMTPKELRDDMPLNDESKAFLRNVMTRMNISARVYDRILKVGRTIADLAGGAEMGVPHLAEAVQYRERIEL